jgi:hypothetical protein
MTDDYTRLSDVFESAPDPPSSAAAGVALCCTMLREESHGEALRLLDRLVDSDALNPVDHGWVLVHRSRIRAKMGDLTGARADAADAQRHFLGDAGDGTVSALASAAAWYLFTTAGPGERDLGRVLTASDTAVAWWRSQTISSALDEASQRAFRAWSETGPNAGRWRIARHSTLRC